MSLVVVPTGTANTASVLAAFRRLGADPDLATDADRVRGSERVVLPGVGSFGAAMEAVDKRGLRQALAERIGEDRPTLAICVGMQLLALSSEESIDARGLEVISEEVRRFPSSVVVPQLGWNRVVVDGGSCRFVSDGWAYFANSFRLAEAPDGWRVATADHGGSFVAAMERGDVLACQFHPELSGSWGLDLLARWMGNAS